MNTNQKILKAKTIQRDIDYWLNIVEQSIESVDYSKHNNWLIKCIPEYIRYIDSALAKAEKLGVDGLLDLQSIHNEITKYTKIYDETIKEEN